MHQTLIYRSTRLSLSLYMFISPPTVTSNTILIYMYNCLDLHFIAVVLQRPCLFSHILIYNAISCSCYRVLLEAIFRSLSLFFALFIQIVTA